ncbi:MAG: hypothetical protein KY468_00915, partial [Armatimonadetes bacterium]|nr:hypothetical protein [Armatimonadota bacterium]
EEELRFQETWPGVDNTGQVVDPGSYTIVGWVTAEDKAELTESSAEVIVQEVRRAGPSVGDLLKNPRAYLNREITLTGVFRAHLAERGERLVEDGPPTSRSDWILKDDTGSIYVAGNGGILFDRRSDLNKRFRVHGLVRMNPEGRLYLRAWEVERLNPSRPR